MTIERRLARAEFTLTRDYPVRVDRVWDAFAEEEQKLAWWGAGDAMEPGEWAFDFRVGGRDVAEGKFHNGPGLAVRGDVHRHRRARPHRHDVRHVARRGAHVDVGGVVRVRADRRGHPVHARRARRLLRPVLGRRAEPRGRQPGPARSSGQLPRVEAPPPRERLLRRCPACVVISDPTAAGVPRSSHTAWCDRAMRLPVWRV